MDENNKFWALVELMGHSRIVGEVSEQVMAGKAFLRVEVPASEINPDGMTKLYGGDAIYAITPMTRESVMDLLPLCEVKPVTAWDLHQIVANKVAELPNGEDEDDEDDEELLF